ncbi:hypothetical protein Tco_0537183 [Tanacetum coccineum]
MKNHLSDDCYSKPKCSTYGSFSHTTKEHTEQTIVRKSLNKLKGQSTSISTPVRTTRMSKTFAHEIADCPKNLRNSRKQRIDIKQSEPTKNGCSRHMTGVKQYLHRYSKEPGPKVVFRDDSSGDTEGYGSVNCSVTKTQGTIFNQNYEVVLIAPRRRDVYIIDMSSFNKESNACFLAKASPRLAFINPIPPVIAEPNFDPKEAIRLIKKLLYDNSSPRPPEELNSEISDAIIKSFSPSPIPVDDNDSLMEEIDIFPASDDSIPPGIGNDDYDLEGDILFLEELLTNDSLSLPENESFHFDRYYVPSFPRPPEKPPDDNGSYFDIEPDMGVLIAKAFNHGIFASTEEKSPHFLSHRGVKTFQIIYDFSESPMMIYGWDMLILDVPYRISTKRQKQGKNQTKPSTGLKRAWKTEAKGVMQKEDVIFISQDKYVDEILKKFGFSTVRIASTPMETSKPLLKEAEAKDVDVHLYRLMIGSLMYLTASRPDIMFVVCACARFQVTPKVSHLHVVKSVTSPKYGCYFIIHPQHLGCYFIIHAHESQ